MMVNLFNILYTKMIHQQSELFGILHKTKHLTPMLHKNLTFAIMTSIHQPKKGSSLGMSIAFMLMN